MDDWSSFRTTTSEQQRLRAALSGFFESQDLPEEQRAAYTAYLRKRIRPAVEMLIREDDFSKLERILQTGWLSDADRKRFLNLAADQQKWQAFRILLNRSSQYPMQENTESRKTEAAFQKEKPTKEKEALALRLFEEARKNLCWMYPELGEAILFFQHQPSDRTKAITSDGHTIYFNSDFVLRMCAENSSFLKEGYQHLLLECIRRFGKETPEPEKKEQPPVSWLMPEKEKQSPVSWLVSGKETELIESFQSVWKVGGKLRHRRPAARPEPWWKKRNPVRDRKKSVRLPPLPETLYRYPRGNGAGSRQLRSSRLPLWAYVLRKFPFHRAAGDARGKPSRRAGYRDRHIRFVQKRNRSKISR